MPGDAHARRADRGPRDDGVLINPPSSPERPGPVAASGLVDHYFRHEYGRTVATLTRLFGTRYLEIVEDAVQTALERALTTWAAKGVPDDPSAWVYRVAHRDAIDALRRSAGRARILDRAGKEATEEEDEAPPPRFASEVEDDMLRMLFVCCDDELPAESRLVLALKTLCGFSTAEIALRLFTSEGNVLKRLGRARDRLRDASVDLSAPSPEALASRLSSVHTVLYLLFNEGYLSASPDGAVRKELCDEAIRLTTVLAEHPVGATPETFALLALMYFHGSRLASRVDAYGGLLLLEEQDRSLWDRGMMDRGSSWMERAAQEEVFTRYHAEAVIAAEHCFAPSFAETRWSEIADFYAVLERIAPSPLHTMNRAIAVAQYQGADAGLAILEGLVPPAWLAGFYLWDAALGELYRQAGQTERARKHVARALESAPSEAERGLLARRLAAIDASR